MVSSLHTRAILLVILLLLANNMAKKFIQAMGMNRGGLHMALGVKMGTPIPAAKMAQAMNSKNPKIKKMAVLAKTLGKFKKKKKK